MRVLLTWVTPGIRPNRVGLDEELADHAGGGGHDAGDDPLVAGDRARGGTGAFGVGGREAWARALASAEVLAASALSSRSLSVDSWASVAGCW